MILLRHCILLQAVGFLAVELLTVECLAVGFFAVESLASLVEVLLSAAPLLCHCCDHIPIVLQHAISLHA
jgi:hypothetical protein